MSFKGKYSSDRRGSRTGRNGTRARERGRRSPRGLEALESRLLLSATWKLAVGSGNWNNSNNWSDVIDASGVPGPKDDVVISRSGTTTITVDVGTGGVAGKPLAIKSLTVQGNASADVNAVLNFNADGREMDINGGITLRQFAGHAASITVGMSGVGGAKIKAKGLSVSPSGTDWATGSNNITVSLGVILDLQGGGFNTGNTVTSVAVEGVMLAGSSYFGGKDLPETGNPTPSTINVTGSFTASGDLRVGGNGAVNMTVDRGTLTAKSKFYLPNVSKFEAKNSATVTLSGAIYIGDPEGAFPLGNGVVTGAGATFTVSGHSHVDASTAAFKISRGKAAELDILSAGTLTVGSLYGGGGVYLDEVPVPVGGIEPPGPTIKISGDGSLLEAVHSISIGNGFANPGSPAWIPSRPSRMQVSDKGKVKVRAGGYLEAFSKYPDSSTLPLLYVDAGVVDAISTDELYVGIPRGGIPTGDTDHYYGCAKLLTGAGGAGTTVKVQNTLIIGNGQAILKWPVYFTVKQGCTVDAATAFVDKKVARFSRAQVWSRAPHPAGLEAEKPARTLSPVTD